MKERNREAGIGAKRGREEYKGKEYEGERNGQVLEIYCRCGLTRRAPTKR